jgi:hypothetical protein
MLIIFDHDLDAQGNTITNHVIDTANPAVQAMLTATKATVAAQTLAGYSQITKHPSYVGMTRWQAILGEVVRLNDVTARGILGV